MCPFARGWSPRGQGLLSVLFTTVAPSPGAGMYKIQPTGQIWPIAGFCIAGEARMIFTF